MIEEMMVSGVIESVHVYSQFADLKVSTDFGDTFIRIPDDAEFEVDFWPGQRFFCGEMPIEFCNGRIVGVLQPGVEYTLNDVYYTVG